MPPFIGTKLWQAFAIVCLLGFAIARIVDILGGVLLLNEVAETGIAVLVTTVAIVAVYRSVQKRRPPF